MKTKVIADRISLVSSRVYTSHLDQLNYLDGQRALTSRAMRLVLKQASKTFATQGSTIIEIGSGNGALRRQFPDGYREWIEVDLVPSHLFESRKLKPGASFVASYGEQLPFKDNFADIVFGFNSFDQYDDLERIVAEAHRVLKPGGQLIHMIDQGQAPVQAKKAITDKGFSYIEVSNPPSSDENISGFRDSQLFYGNTQAIKEIIETIPSFMATLKKLGSRLQTYQFEIHLLEKDIPESTKKMITQLELDDGYSFFSEGLESAIHHVFSKQVSLKYWAGIYAGVPLPQQSSIIAGADLSKHFTIRSQLVTKLQPPIEKGLLTRLIARNWLSKNVPGLGKYLRQHIVEQEVVMYVVVTKD